MIHQFFLKREPEEWNIIDFLKECNNLGSYQQIILCYISSLDEIIKTKEGVEAEKAQKLFDHYKKGSRPDCTLARNWWDKHTKVDQSSIHMQITGIETINVNTSASKKRTFLEIDELNTTNNEDINEFDDENIINEEQVKGHNLEESWEFEQSIPDWLKRIHQHREDLAITTDATNIKSLSQVSETAIWWRIIDTSDPKLSEIITEGEFLNLNESLLSNLPSDWDVLEPPVERCLHSIAMLDTKGLKKVAKTAIYYGVRGSINKIRKKLTTSNKVEDENPFLDSPPTEITTADNIVQDGDYKHPDVCYIIELLRYTYNMIDKKIPQRENSERDIDVIFKNHLFSCFDDIMDLHFGEVVSRASRQRRTQAIDASDKAEGYHLDWLFTKHDLAKDLTWGREFSLCERAGSKIENGRKILNNTLKVQKTLRDMHQTLLETLSNAGGGALPVKVVQGFRKLLLPGFISSRFFIRVLLNVYIGGKYYGSIILAEFDIPTQFDEMNKISTIAWMMLQVKNIFKQTIKNFTLMEEASKKKKYSVENVLVSSRVKEHVSPKKQKVYKTKK